MEKMSNLIERTAAIDALIEGFKRSPTIAIRAKDMIEQLPPAQPEPDWTEMMVVCDNCGHIIHVKRVNVLPLGRAEGR